MTYCWWTKSSVIDNDEISRKDPQSIHNPLTIPSIFFPDFITGWLSGFLASKRMRCHPRRWLDVRSCAQGPWDICSMPTTSWWPSVTRDWLCHRKNSSLESLSFFFFFFGVFSLTDADFSTSKWPKTLASLEVVFFLLQVWLSGEASRAFQPSKGVTGWIETSELLVASQPWWCGKQRDFGISSGWISTCLGGSHVSWKGHWFESCF